MTSECKYTRYQVKNKDKAFSGSPRAKSDKWQLIIERDVPNPNYIPKEQATDANGNDKRTRGQKRRHVAEQKTTMYKGAPVTEAKAKEAALAWMDAENAKLAKPDKSGVLVPDFVDSYLESHDVADSTMSGYLSAAKHIRNEFEGVLMGELTAEMVEQWLLKLKRGGYSEQTRYRDYKVLHMVCRFAARRDVGVIDYDPTAEIRTRPEQNKSRENAESNCLVLEAPQGQESTYDKHLRILADMEPTPLVTASYIATYAGLRCGEVCGLRWWDVDLDNAIIHVRNAVGTKGRIKDRKGGAYLKDTKTNSSSRDVPMNQTLTEKLRERKARMMGELTAAGVEVTDDVFKRLFVVGSIDGSYANPTTLSKQWTAHAEAFGLRGKTGKVVTFHGLRHTFASALVLAGLDVKTISELLGHTSAALTLNVYASSNEYAKRRAVDALEKANKQI